MDRIKTIDAADASILRRAGFKEFAALLGRFDVWCVRDGKEIWRDTIDNLVTDVGARYILDNILAGSGYTVDGPFLGLISAASFSAVDAGDTMGSHAGWYECSASHLPAWDTPASCARHTLASGWSAASGRAKALSAAKMFEMDASGSGTIKGAFIVISHNTGGAVATNSDAGGTLLSVGLFNNGDKGPLGENDQINVSYSLTLGV